MDRRSKEAVMEALGYGGDVVRVPLTEETRRGLAAVFSPGFMREYTKCGSFEEFMFSSAVFVNWDSALLVYSKRQFDAFVAETTSFGTWQEMMEKGREVYLGGS
ncbi:MAG: hypothetical protein LBS32_04605 [Clostridiales Family XIII bacterium]|jgi:hypothetical protein|nr:hypothetical protein [Clostridiales Family XIII bacterium]